MQLYQEGCYQVRKYQLEQADLTARFDDFVLQKEHVDELTT